jgi:nitroreductase
MSEQILNTIKTRRVIREMSDRPVERALLEKILEAGRWAPAGGNMRACRFVVVQDPLTIRLVRAFSPGMFQRPQALVLICIDWDVIRANRIPESDRTPYIDVGAAMQTMMLAAHALGLGSGPVTSFSETAIEVILNLPPNLSPEVIICIGYPAPPEKPQLPMRPKGRVTWQSLTDWERRREAK